MVSFVILSEFGRDAGRSLDAVRMHSNLDQRPPSAVSGRADSHGREGTFTRRRATRRAPPQILPLHPIIHADALPLPARVLVVGDGLLQKLEEHRAVGLVEPEGQVAACATRVSISA